MRAYELHNVLTCKPKLASLICNLKTTEFRGLSPVTDRNAMLVRPSDGVKLLHSRDPTLALKIGHLSGMLPCIQCR